MNTDNNNHETDRGLQSNRPKNWKHIPRYI